MNTETINDNDNYEYEEDELFESDMDLLTQDEQLSIEKYLYKQTFKLDNIDSDTMDKIYRRSHLVHNFNYLVDGTPFDIDNVTIDNRYIKKIFGKPNYDEFEYLLKLRRKKDSCLELLKDLGFNLKNIRKNNVFSKEKIKKIKT